MSHSARSDIPCLDSHPVFQAYRYVTAPLALLDECADRFGDLFMLRMFGLGDWVMVASPKHLKTLFTADPEQLHAGAANRSVFGPLTGEATVLTMDEMPHRRRKRLLLPPFCGERLNGYAGEINRITRQRINRWVVGERLPMHREVQRMALQVILKVVFGIREQGTDPRLVGLLTRLADLGAGSSLFLMPALQRDLGRYSPWGRIKRLIRETDNAIFGEIARRREALSDGDSGENILSLLLTVRDEEGQPLTDRDLRDELITILLAGHETTATSLAWTFERILSLPDVNRALDTELAKVLDDQPIEHTQLSKLEYLNAVINESLRTRPIMPNGGSRVVMAPFDIGGYTVPAGAIISNCLYLLHRRPDLYPEPDKFLPQRFIGITPDPYEWTPFGGGLRRCLGMAFALFEMKIIVATVLSNTRLRIEHPNAKVKRRGFFLTPDDGVQVVLEDRKSG
jgi:cytochrome P450 family 110